MPIKNSLNIIQISEKDMDGEQMRFTAESLWKNPENFKTSTEFNKFAKYKQIKNITLRTQNMNLTDTQLIVQIQNF